MPPMISSRRRPPVRSTSRRRRGGVVRTRTRVPTRYKPGAPDEVCSVVMLCGCCCCQLCVPLVRVLLPLALSPSPLFPGSHTPPINTMYLRDGARCIGLPMSARVCVSVGPSLFLSPPFLHCFNFSLYLLLLVLRMLSIRSFARSSTYIRVTASLRSPLCRRCDWAG